MPNKQFRLNQTALWLLAAATGLAENWMMSSFRLSAIQRTEVALGLPPILVFLALVWVFQQMALDRR